MDGLRTWARMEGKGSVLTPASISSAVYGAVTVVVSAMGLLASLTSVTAYLLGPFSKSAGKIRTFYGEDKRHATKLGEAYNGVRLVLKKTIDAQTVRARVLAMLKKEGQDSLLRVILLSSSQYTFTDVSDAEVADYLIHYGESGVQEPARSACRDSIRLGQAASLLAASLSPSVLAAYNPSRCRYTKTAEAMWASGLPLRIYVHEHTLDLMAHHAIFDGIRGIRLLNELFGNLGAKGAIRPQDLPCCLLACGTRALARVLTYERPRGLLSTKVEGATAFHESHYIRVPTALIKRVKETHGVGFAPALQACGRLEFT